MSRRTTHLLGSIAALAALLTVLAPAAVAEPTPGLRLDTERVSVGAAVQVEGRDWPVAELVEVAVCSTGTAGAEPACAAGAVADVAVMWDGSFTQTLVVQEPPASCPCAVVVTSGTGASASVPVRFERSSKGGRDVTGLVVEESALETGSPFAGWFGGALDSTLVLLVRNTGNVPTAAALDLSGSDGVAPATAAPAALPLVPPGETATLRVPVRVDGLEPGDRVVQGMLVAGDLRVPVEARTTVMPWGIVGALLAGLAVVVGWLALARGGGAPRPAIAPVAPAHEAPARRVPVLDEPAPRPADATTARGSRGPVAAPVGGDDLESRALAAISRTAGLPAGPTSPARPAVWVPRQRSPLSTRLAARSGPSYEEAETRR